jgi:hypothetical protein
MVEAFKVKLHSALHDHGEYATLAKGESSPGLEAAINTLLVRSMDPLKMHKRIAQTIL